jgi:oxygen-independent coproporphyrinogen-3 oxidase
MAGIYFHIPFCRSKCIYCDFFSITSMEEKGLYVDAVCAELRNRIDYLQRQTVDTIYFGGGTPSQLSANDFEKIFETLTSLPLLRNDRWENCEITLEANPDDLTPVYLDSIKHLPFNRISLGIQSLNDDELKFLQRRHDASSAIRAVRRLQENGFGNISIDLMYGLPGQTRAMWESTLRQTVALNVQHISAYHLIYEEETRMFQLLKQGILQPVEEELSIQLFETLMDTLSGAGFEHYEISNFARPGFRSKHNASYWNGTHYLGIGAAAHSYNGISRQWNKRAPGAAYRTQGFEMEEIDEQTAYNDFIITRLRTKEGINLTELQTLFGEEKTNYCCQQAGKYIVSRRLTVTDNHLHLTRQGIFVSDSIMSDLIDA